jgi:branched-chain amino acid transport system ATP-binding protein
MPDRPALRVQGLRVDYGPVQAVRDLALHVERGEVVGLIGPNGAGKTSTLAAIMGMVGQCSGRIELQGRPLARLRTPARVRAGLALVPQGRQVFGGLSVADNLRAGSWLRPARERVSPSDAVAAFPELQGKLRQQAATLSGGEQQLLVLARALVSDPRWLLLDEPSMGLAPIVIDRIAEAIGQLAADRSIGVLIVDQGLGLVRRIADRIYLMAQGTINDELDRSVVDDTDAVARAYFG